MAFGGNMEENKLGLSCDSKLFTLTVKTKVQGTDICVNAEIEKTKY